MPLLFAILPFFSTLLGGAAALRLQHRLHPVMAFAAGVLVATALVDLLPEAAELIGTNGSVQAGVAAVVGFLVFSALDALLHRGSWERQDAASGADHTRTAHTDDGTPASAVLGILAPAGLIIHSTLDGLAIGLAFRAGNEVGLLVALAVLTHDFADGMNVVTLALTGGQKRTGAMVLLVLDALAPPLGAAIGSVVSIGDPTLGLMLATFAGVFVAIGAGHLLPEAQHRRPDGAPLLIALTAAGAGVAVFVRTILG